MNTCQFITNFCQCPFITVHSKNSNAICFQTIGSIQKLPIGSDMNISTSFGADRIGSYILDSIQFSFMIRKSRYFT